ncbi:MAG: Holliday junction resolvase RuvX [Eubacteriales bacterium]|nr:Holliday junction resolvase RuvX [Eubacteriales bacterium]
MKIMSVDYGDARTGIAFCDKNEILATAFTTINESYAPKLVSKIKEIVDEQKPEMIVVGLPRNMDGSYGFRCDKCKQLGKLLQEEVGIPVEFEDERLTTVIAHDILSSNNIKSKKHKNNVDAVSAVVILQSFIDKRK